MEGLMEGLMEIRLLKNCFGPEEPTDGTDCIGEGWFGLLVAGTMAEMDAATLGMLGRF